MLKRTYTKLASLLVFALLATQVISADPAPANPPSSGDPAPASPPNSSMTVIATDPAPASPPAPSTVAADSDPAPASPPASTPLVLIDMPDMTLTDRQLADDPQPASAPGTSAPKLVDAVPSIAAAAGRPFLGVGFRDPTTTTVTTLWANSTAARLGIRLGDNVISINGSPVGNLEQIRDLLSTMSVGDAATVTVQRDAAPLRVGPLPLGATYE